MSDRVPDPPTAPGRYALGADSAVDGIDNLEPVGRGGYGSVYRGYEQGLGRTVAVKFLTTSLRPRDRARFEREGRALGQLSGHPHIVPVHRVGVTGEGVPYLVMAYCASGSLGDRMAAGPLPWREVLRHGVHLAGALATAHEKGILHRDLKPENVLLSDFGVALLADFGIASLESDTDGVLTTEGTVVASLAHAAPEVVGGQRATVQSDVYGLGSTLAALLLGDAPFARRPGEQLVAQLLRITTESIDTARLRATGVPDDLIAVIARSMAHEPASRHGSARSFGRSLQAVERRHGVPMTELVAPPEAPTDRAGAGGEPSHPPGSERLDGPPARERQSSDPQGPAAEPDGHPTRVSVPPAAEGGSRPPSAGNTESAAPLQDPIRGDGPVAGRRRRRAGRRGLVLPAAGGTVALAILLVVLLAVLLAVVASWPDGDGAGRAREGLSAQSAPTAVSTTVAPGGTSGPAGLSGARGIAVARDGTIYIADYDRHRIVRRGPTGVIDTVAGTGVAGNDGDGGPGPDARVSFPTAIAVDDSGNVAFSSDGAVRTLDPRGIISTLPTPQGRYLGLEALAWAPDGTWVGGGGSQLWRIHPDGRLDLLAGSETKGASGDGGPARDALLTRVLGVAVAPDGTVYLTDGTDAVRRIRPDGIIERAVGDSASGDARSSDPSATRVSGVEGVAVDGTGALVYGELSGYRVRRLGGDGKLSTLAGDPDGKEAGFSGDGGPATAARFGAIRDVEVSASGDIVVLDQGNRRVRVIGTDGVVRTVA